MLRQFNFRWLFKLMAVALVVISCDEETDPPVEAPVASFQFEVDETDPMTVQFTSFSQNATAYSWDFGDDSNASTEENPEHTYAAGGAYQVTLTVTGADGATDSKTETVNVTSADAELEKLAGTSSKTWKLLRDVSGGSFPMSVGPEDRSTVWWSFGGNEQLGARPCVLDDEYIFSTDGTFEYKTNGDFWADANVWEGTPGCRETEAANFVNVDGTDISAWGDGVHEFEYDPSANELTVSGLGAFIGLQKAATDAEVTVPQEEVTYKVVRLTAGDVDTLIVETTIPAPGYWRFVLVHYDDPADEPAIPGANPVAAFTYEIDGKEVTFTNTSSSAVSYSWDFGDGATSTEANPVHTYANDGVYTVELTATNANGDATTTQDVTISSSVLTLDALTGGGEKIWKLKPGVGSFKVGDSRGAGNWWGGDLDLSGVRTCLFDDEFIFKTGGVYEYDSKGQIWAEPFMGLQPEGCFDETELPAASEAWGSAEHEFTFTPADGATPAKITVSGTGAFIALAKAHNGGEYAAGPPETDGSVTYEVVSYVNDNGTEVLTIAVDIAPPGWWTFVLVAE